MASRKNLILRKPRSGCLEGRTVPAAVRNIRTLSARVAGVGDEAGAFDAVDRAHLVVVGSVAADADRPQDLARRVADQHAARHRDDAAARGADERLDEGRVADGAAGEFAAAEAHAEGAPGLAAGDLRAQQAGAVLALRRLQLAAGVEHHDGQRLEAALAPFFEHLVENDRGLVEAQSAHLPPPQTLAISSAQRSRVGSTLASFSAGR